MELVSGSKKRITGKSFIHKETGLCGRVLKSSLYLVTVKFNNKRVKTYTRPEFERVCEIIQVKKPIVVRPKIEVEDFVNKCFVVIKNYINQHFRYDDVVFDYKTMKKMVVYINGAKCGKINLDSMGLKITFKRPLPPPTINEYKIKTNYDEYTYLFTDLSKESISAIKLTINWLLLCGKESQK